jgi:hypothetical protein
MFLDRLFASREERATAKRIAEAAIHTRGADAERYLRLKLQDPTRKRSLREFRLALDHVRRSRRLSPWG